MGFWLTYAHFAIELASIVIAILIIVAGILTLASKGKDLEPGKIKVKNINEKYDDLQKDLGEEILEKKERKAIKKSEKQKAKAHKKSKEEAPNKKVFVIQFNGDIKASQVTQLTQMIDSILLLATKNDEVVINLKSPGGSVTGYGLAASQLQRIRNAGITLTACVDEVAASGGYMMACIANKIVASPFAIIGSIGVVAQIPNLHRFLKEKNIDFEQVTAGKYKRTLTVFGENTEEGREKFKQELEDIHTLFKQLIAEHRPQLNMDEVANGEFWLARDAKDRQLVDDLCTSDDYLMSQRDDAKIFELYIKPKKSVLQKLTKSAKLAFENMLYSKPQYM